MNVIAKILMTLVLAVATLVANATCVCTRAAVARGPRACCLRTSDGNGSGGHPATAKCGQCHASALTAGERDASPISFAIAPMPTFESLLYVAVPAPRLAARSLAAPPPADVLERRHVIQV